MCARVLLMFAAVCFVAADAAEPAKKELEKLQGEWQLEMLIFNGKEMLPANLGDAKAKVKGDEVTLSEQLKVKIKLDPTPDPKIIDVQVEGFGTFEGIYEVNGDTVKVCLSTAAGRERPTDFEVGENSQRIYYVYKRIKS